MNIQARSDPILEVIVCSVTDALQAKCGGANRLEVVRDLSLGGLTPSLKLVSAIQDAVDLPLRVMLRESVGYQASDPKEIDALLVNAERLARIGVDGVVIGFLNENQIDVELTARVLASAPELKATFHHAFEATQNQLTAMRDIKRLPQVDRILSNGGVGDLKQRAERLAVYTDHAASRLKIIAGGGVDKEMILILRRTTSIHEFHVGRAARSGYQVDGDVQAELVSGLVQVMLA